MQIMDQFIYRVFMTCLFVVFFSAIQVEVLRVNSKLSVVLGLWLMVGTL